MIIDHVPSHILRIQPYQPGKPIAEVQREQGLECVIKLASNENPLGPSPKAVEVIKHNVEELHYYPEDSGFYLKKRISEKFGVEPAMICLGNGSSEIIVNVGRAFLKPGDEVLTSEKSFVLYYLCGAYLGNPTVCAPMAGFAYDLDALAARIGPATRVIFLANPNNPTGTYFTRDALASFLSAVPDDILVVLDEAYNEYITEPDYPRGLDFLPRHPNLLVLHSFSKIYGLAGIRVGYGMGDPAVVDILNRVKLPFNANALGQDAATAALDDDAFVERSRKVNREGLDFLHGFLGSHGYSFQRSVGNFVLVNLPVDGKVVASLMEKRGVIVRPLRSFGIPNAIRVTAGVREENERFAAAFHEVMTGLPEGA